MTRRAEGTCCCERAACRRSVATGTSADDKGVAQVVEIDETRLDAHFVAMFLRADAAALPVGNTQGAVSREDLRRCRIPRMPLAEQRRYGDAVPPAAGAGGRAASRWRTVSAR